jgi:hypothetical protein
VALASCASHRGKVTPVRQNILQGKCDAALAALDDLTSKESDDRLLYLMEYGSALQICKNFKKSNEILQTADALSEQIDYHSVSRIVGATLLNESMIQYKGDKFEKIFINALSALNYLELGQPDEAMVEVRRIDEKYRRFSAEEKRSFELNSFSKYLSGLIWEAGFKYDDACIDYKQSFQLDKSYRAVGLDMLTACWRARRSQEFNNLVKEMAASPGEIEFAKRKPKREVVLVYLQGWGPQKAVRRGDALYPILAPTPSQTKKLVAEWEGNSAATEKVYSVEAAAMATLEADYNALAARRIGARVAKEVVADQIRQKDKALGAAAWLIMVASEHADLRNWTFLPESLQILRIDPGSAEKIKLRGEDNFGKVSEAFEDIDLTLNPNKKIYLIRSIK